MSASALDLALYAGAVAILFATPGPVWVALTARALSGGFHAAWPLALGVVVGDALWPALAVFGVAWVVSVFDGFMATLRLVASGIFLVMGLGLIRRRHRVVAADNRLTRPGAWAGFTAGLAVILGNPKAILFYMGALPGFFDLGHVTAGDVGAIMAISMAVPLAGNLVMAAFLGRIRTLLKSPAALARLNLVAGLLLVAVGVAIPFT
ncbi:Threonine/homoserine/homoserine lactone efflux protein [Meinhardsimonia xiamenensis]|jgi:threonine/homoserine/homoserine lactone efflux protein|uniref:Threonine/homoserine/homoserine lactone efflux protein n=1 Tax=Meinhardsimonia xiamenensis TaxID=990712 RepID=A0A1G9ELE0_9RHOB|nr:LysE family translocator [Meinhardsimonia xiamenensis]PRX33721.1 threonine/homoserine/homoserine lactone efflux protein [Meinhardsimonia xiamenensis]SDK76893.1 Threonine/homoserine/homoserine lactone efflux protein [Meinhardsimonia xiamenensis]